MNYSGIINCSIVDGTGFRVSLFVSGCKHCCKNCHNRETWDFKSGKPYTKEVEDVLFDRLSSPHIKGLTLTGGDPMYSANEVYELLVRFREKFGDTKDVWIYTGFTYEYCKEHFGKVLELCDYIVDGEFDCKLKSYNTPFRGSSNQRIIDIKADSEILVK
jgi:anaerobic ribonucleoside-triphosphate reductase activating protein